VDDNHVSDRLNAASVVAMKADNLAGLKEWPLERRDGHGENRLLAERTKKYKNLNSCLPVRVKCMCTSRFGCVNSAAEPPSSSTTVVEGLSPTLVFSFLRLLSRPL